MASEADPDLFARDFSFKRFKLCRLRTNYSKLLAVVADINCDCFNIDSIYTIKVGAANITNAIGTVLVGVAGTNCNGQAASTTYTVLKLQKELAANSNSQGTIRISTCCKDDLNVHSSIDTAAAACYATSTSHTVSNCFISLSSNYYEFADDFMNNCLL